MTVDGYPGFFSITRQELLDKMARQAKYQTTIKYAERVSRLELQDDIKKIYQVLSVLYCYDHSGRFRHIVS